MNNADKIVADIELLVDDLTKYAKEPFIEQFELNQKQRRIMDLVHRLRRHIKSPTY